MGADPAGVHTDIGDLELLQRVLVCYRTPLAHPEWLSPTLSLPRGMDRLLLLANGSPEALEQAAHQTGSERAQMQAAASFFIQQVCFVRSADHYRVLGLRADATAEQIKEHHRLLMRLVHPDRQGVADLWADAYAARVNEAYSVLSRPLSRERYDALLQTHRAEAKAMVSRPVSFRPLSHASQDDRPAGLLSVRLRQSLPVWVLGGTALVATLLVWSLYLQKRAYSARFVTPPPSVLDAAPSDSTHAASDAIPGNAMAALQAMPDWQALEQRESAARARAASARNAEEQLESVHQRQLQAETEQLERLRRERDQLEQQLQAVHAETERQRLLQLQAEQQRAQQAQTERLEVERRRLQQLQAERAQAEQLAAQLRAERLKLEQMRTDQLQAERLAAQLRAEQDRTRQLAAQLRVQQQPPAAPVAPAKVDSPPIESRKAEQAEQQVRAQRLEAERLQAEQQARAMRDVMAPELDSLIGHYAGAYERGDLGGLMGLFATQARVNGSQDLGQLRRDYADFFNTTRARRINLRNLRWERHGPDASGQGRYELYAMRVDGAAHDHYQGNIRFDVQKQDGQLRIVGFHYDIQAQ
jgi:curved DNA-binding protein CbpA